MRARSSRARASSAAAATGLDRRSFLLGLGALLLLPGRARGEAAASWTLPEATEELLRSSPYVYVSPLRADGAESRCHGEVWYGWLDGAVVLTTSTGTWKARAVARGLDRARLWVGDYGRWKRFLGRNEAFRAGPSFVARAGLVDDPALLDRLLALYREKYPAEIGRWEPRMRSGHASRDRVLIRYQPLAAR